MKKKKKSVQPRIHKSRPGLVTKDQMYDKLKKAVTTKVEIRRTKFEYEERRGFQYFVKNIIISNKRLKLIFTAFTE